MAKNTTRSASIATEQDLRILLSKHDAYISKIKRLKNQSENNDIFLTWSESDMQHRLQKIDEISVYLDQIHMKIICDHNDDEHNNFIHQSEEIDDSILALKAKLSDRMLEMNRVKSQSMQHKHMNPFKKQVELAQQHFERNESIPEFLQCILCEDIHPLYGCDVFRAMDFNERRNHVDRNDLCERCLRKNHSGRCKRKANNRKCPKCKPESKFHNSWLCPNSEIMRNSALLDRKTQEKSKKRKYQRLSQSKRCTDSKSDSDSDSEEDLQSHVNKIGYWAFMAEGSKAIKRMRGINKA